MKGHYSVLEPDGSIRSVHYSADAKNGFTAVVKTHGPNSHPTDGHSPDDDLSSQSKINHFSKDQEHIVLSSDLHPKKRPIIDLNQDDQKIPSLYEIKPNIERYNAENDGILNKYSYDDHKFQTFNYGEEFHPSYEARANIRSVAGPNFAKHRPSEPYIAEYQKNNLYNADTELEYEVYPQYYKPVQSRQFKPSEAVIYGQAKANVKSHATAPCLVAKYCGRSLRGRNDYASYFLQPVKSKKGPVMFADDEQRAASSRMVQSMIARANHGNYPIYANRNINYS